jgi:hypothetical protein
MMENSIDIQKASFIALVPNEQVKTIAQILMRAILIAGTKPTEDEIEAMILEVRDLIRTRYHNLTISEISETIKNGAMGDYQESYLSVRNINAWLKICKVEKAVRIAKEEKKKAEENQMPIVERGNFLLNNIDKLPSLKKLMDNNETKRG